MNDFDTTIQCDEREIPLRLSDALTPDELAEFWGDSPEDDGPCDPESLAEYVGGGYGGGWY